MALPTRIVFSGAVAAVLVLGANLAEAQDQTYSLYYQDDTTAEPMPEEGTAAEVATPPAYQAPVRALPPCPPAKKPAPNPCATSHKGVFFDNNFSYLEKPDNDTCCFGDGLKRLDVGPCCQSKLDIGGQFRLRYHHEEGMGQEGGLGRFQSTNTDFLLERLRLYGNYQITPDIRFFAEGIFADVTDDGSYIPRAIDRNWGDLLNIFLDVKLFEELTLRVGRQELLYGNQRTVSPLDWANTRRTFEGVKLMVRHCDWSIDGFYTHLVNVDVDEFDSPDYDQPFYGLYGVYSGFENSTLDLYYLGYENETVGAPVATNFSLHTIGGRVNGSNGSWLYEVEGAGQFGRQYGLDADHLAMFATGGIGYKFDDACWKPTLWFFYDYATGDNPGGSFNRYNQLFPLAHKYLGFIDAVQRSNIQSPNVLLTAAPTKKLSLLLWYYHFMSAQDTDIVPSIGGTSPQSLTSRDLGDELDLIATYQLGPRMDILFGYSHFWRGNKILAPNDADFFYTQFQLNF